MNVHSQVIADYLCHHYYYCIMYRNAQIYQKSLHESVLTLC